MARPIGIAAVDAGSNAIRIVVARADSATDISFLASERWAVRLGHNVFTRRRLAPRIMAGAVDTFRHFRTMLRQHDVHLFRAVATSAVREAENRDLLLQRVFRESGVRLEAIDAAEEARLVRLAVHAALADLKPRLIADLGGGSFEVSLLRERRLEQSLALPLGTVRLMETMDLTGEVSEEKCERLRHYLTSLLRSAWPNPPSLAGQLTVLSGGNAETLARLSPGPRFHGIPTINLRLLRDRVWEILRRDIRTRMRVFGLRRDRAEVVGIAAVVFLCLAEHTQMDNALVPGVGVREGILYDLAAEHFRSPGADKHRAETFIEQARAFAGHMHCDLKHSEQVRRLAASLFDQLSSVHSQPPEMRLPLEMAALLHDCGMSVNFKGHHKHGEYIVLNAALGAISDELQTIVACLVRYHGKSEPELHHKLYASLTQRQRRRVRELSTILRIAAGLDEGGVQLVQDVEVRVRGKNVRIRLRMAGRIAPDLAVMRLKARPFEQEFGVRLEFTRTHGRIGRTGPAAGRSAKSLKSWKQPPAGAVWTLSA